MKTVTTLSRQAAAEGMVLLKNESVLPLKNKCNVALFGRCQLDYYKSGTGSGGAVHVPYTSNAVDGLKRYDTIELNETLLQTYQSWVDENPFDDGGGGWAAEPWFQKEMSLTDETVVKAGKVSDVAVIILGRTAGEDQDNFDVEGSYRLTSSELEMIDKVTRAFEDVIVVLNVSNIIDMSWLETYQNKIKGVLYAWHGGMEGGNALGDVLTGKTNPSGKLTDTIATKLSAYPSHENFGNEVANIYKEDIYVGYRYFETFNKDEVMYPFGFGLSYTTFSTVFRNVKCLGKTLEFRVSVENTGDLPGKEIIQLYYKAPQGLLGKPSRALCYFEKTKELDPGEIVELNFSIEIDAMASYDDKGQTDYRSSYVLEAGDYQFFLGSDVRAAAYICTYNINSLRLVEKLKEAMAPIKTFERIKPKLIDDRLKVSYDTVATRTLDLEKRINNNKPAKLDYKKTNHKLESVEKGEITLEEFVAQLDIKALATLVKGEGMCSPKTVAGTASAFGGLSNQLQNYGLPVLACADGPSGIRMDSGEKASQVPIGTALACTWNAPLVEALYECIGNELSEHHIDTLLGPGMNIHRHPLNGRNFEYYSEDPYVTGIFGSAMTTGLKKGGSQATLKHFIANNQEKERHTSDSIVSERALREIYLKGFEMAVKSAGAMSIMTSYNPINSIYAASNYDLNTTILRNEWGYKGIVMTDWWAKTNHPVEGGVGKTYHKSYMVNAQNDLYMVVDHDVAVNFDEDDLLESVENGSLTIGELQRSALNICRFILNSHTYKSKFRHTNKRFFNALKQASYSIIKTNEVTALQEFSLSVEEAGVYEIYVSSRYLSTSLAQSSFNVRINRNIAVMNQMHGSDEDYKIVRIAEIEFESGFYDVSLEFIRKGIEVKHIEFRKL